MQPVRCRRSAPSGIAAPRLKEKSEPSDPFDDEAVTAGDRANRLIKWPPRGSRAAYRRQPLAGIVLILRSALCALAAHSEAVAALLKMPARAQMQDSPVGAALLLHASARSIDLEPGSDVVESTRFPLTSGRTHGC